MSKLYLTNTERALLSTVLNDMDSGWFDHIIRLGGSDPAQLFFTPAHKAVFNSLRKLYASSGTPTIPRLVDLIEEQSPGVFDDITESILDIQLAMPFTTIESLSSATDDLRKKSELRTQISEMETIIGDIQDPDIDANPEDVAKRLEDVIASTDVTTTAETFAEIADDVLNSARPMWSIKTDIDVLDEAMGGRGLESSCFFLISARPKVGKTVLMNNLVNTVKEKGGTPLVLNLETKRIEFVSKMMARHISDPNLNWGQIKSYIAKEELEGKGLTKKNLDDIHEAIEWAREQDWLVSFDKNMNMHDIYALVVKAKSEAPADARIVLFVDYIQLQVQDSFKEREEITQLSRFYKKIAGQLDIAVVALAQLNRTAADSKPSVHQLRGSGALEQDADAIVLLHRNMGEENPDPKHYLRINAGTTRLAEGSEGICFMDGATQTVSNMPAHLLEPDDGDDGMFETLTNNEEPRYRGK